jgi:hypothetical protein
MWLTHSTNGGFLTKGKVKPQFYKRNWKENGKMWPFNRFSPFFYTFPGKTFKFDPPLSSPFPSHSTSWLGNTTQSAVVPEQLLLYREYQKLPKKRRLQAKK